MSEVIVEVRDLHRQFDNVHAVRGLSFAIRRGQVVGFIGANGAGKTTTMRLMATLDQPTTGTICVCGFDVINQPNEVRRRIGWMPDAYGTYDHVTVAEYLDFFARAYGYAGAEREQRVAEVMQFADLTPLADRPMNTLSKGMGQRLCFGRTLVHDPEFLLLDEPAAGLDPKARIELIHLIRLLAEEGKTIFISSHILSELAEMCDTLLFIDGGQIVHHGSAEDLKKHEVPGAVVDVQVSGDPAVLAQWITLNPGVKLLELRKHGARLTIEQDQPDFIAATLRRMVADGLPVVEFHREQRRLEDAFVEMLKKIDGQEAAAKPPVIR